MERNQANTRRRGRPPWYPAVLPWRCLDPGPLAGKPALRGMKWAGFGRNPANGLRAGLAAERVAQAVGVAYNRGA